MAARARAGRLVDEAHPGGLERSRAPPADPRPRSRRGAIRARASPGSDRSAALPARRAELERGVVGAPVRVQEGDVRRLRRDVLARAGQKAEEGPASCGAEASRSATAMATWSMRLTLIMDGEGEASVETGRRKGGNLYQPGEQLESGMRERFVPIIQRDGGLRPRLGPGAPRPVASRVDVTRRPARDGWRAAALGRIRRNGGARRSLRARIAASEVGGVMLFRPNIADPGQVAALVGALRGAAPADAPLLVSIDQEGGLVQRLRGLATVWPPMLAVGASGDPARTAAVGRALGDELAALGIGWDFAPVLDVHTNPANPVIGNRAFGDRAGGGRPPRARVLARAARGRPRRLRQALPGSRRHAHRLAPRAAGRAARPRSPARASSSPPSRRPRGPAWRRS